MSLASTPMLRCAPSSVTGSPPQCRNISLLRWSVPILADSFPVLNLHHNLFLRFMRSNSTLHSQLHFCVWGNSIFATFLLYVLYCYLYLPGSVVELLPPDMFDRRRESGALPLPVAVAWGTEWIRDQISFAERYFLKMTNQLCISMLSMLFPHSEIGPADCDRLRLEHQQIRRAWYSYCFKHRNARRIIQVGRIKRHDSYAIHYLDLNKPQCRVLDDLFLHYMHTKDLNLKVSRILAIFSSQPLPNDWVWNDLAWNGKMLIGSMRQLNIDEADYRHSGRHFNGHASYLTIHRGQYLS
jgi:hypothetical protein